MKGGNTSAMVALTCDQSQDRGFFFAQGLGLPIRDMEFDSETTRAKPNRVKGGGDDVYTFNRRHRECL